MRHLVKGKVSASLQTQQSELNMPYMQVLIWMVMQAVFQAVTCTESLLGQDSYFQYMNVPGKGKYEFGFSRGNNKHTVARYEQFKDGRFRTKVNWADSSGGSGEQYWEYNHVDKGQHAPYKPYSSYDNDHTLMLYNGHDVPVVISPPPGMKFHNIYLQDHYSGQFPATNGYQGGYYLENPDLPSAYNTDYTYNYGEEGAEMNKFQPEVNYESTHEKPKYNHQQDNANQRRLRFQGR